LFGKFHLHSLDHSTLDLGNARPKLKDGLRFSLRQRGEETWYLIEDEVNARYFRVGLLEAMLLSLLDGKRTVQEALALVAQFSGESQLDDVTSARICNFLIHSGLAYTESSRSVGRISSKEIKAKKAKRIQKLNPIAVSIPIMNPDLFFTQINRSIGWLLGWPFLVFGILAILYGLVRLCMNWDDFSITRLQTYTKFDWMWFALSWIIVKIIHEIGHGITCKRLGGKVQEFGIVLFMFIPLPYVDVSSSWSFDRRCDRMAVAAAGMFFELIAGALAIFVWANLDPGPLRYHLEDAILAATLHTVIFNLNPLMRFDGYFLLSDAIDAPNLFQQGRQFVVALAQKFFLDPKTVLPTDSRLQNFIRCYGLASWVWSQLLTITLFVGACNLLEGIGVLIGGLGLTLWLIPAIRGLIRSLQVADEWDQRRVHRMARSLATVGGFALLMGLVLPAPPSVVAPIVLDHRQQSDLRAIASGFVEKIHVEPYQLVSQGQLLVEMSNPELIARRDDMRTELKASELKARSLYEKGNIAAAMAEREMGNSLADQLKELDYLVNSLNLRAPLAGQVLTPDLGSQLGRFFDSGQKIVSVGDPDTLEAIALVKQVDAESLTKHMNSPVKVHVWGARFSRLPARIHSIDPRATKTLPHEAFASPNGGPLAVAPADSVKGDGELVAKKQDHQAGRGNEGPSQEQWQLLDAYVKVNLSLQYGNQPVTSRGKLVMRF
jgi:putative peptide zinc metalloprotease protein